MFFFLPGTSYVLQDRLFFIDSALSPARPPLSAQVFIISDHALLSLDIKLSFHVESPSLFNSLLLQDNNFCKFISTSTDNFLEFNQNDSETLKVYLRGQVMSFTAKDNKVHKAKINSCPRLHCFYQQYSSDPSLELFKQRLKLQTGFDLVSSRDGELCY